MAEGELGAGFGRGAGGSGGWSADGGARDWRGTRDAKLRHAKAELQVRGAMGTGQRSG